MRVRNTIAVISMLLSTLGPAANAQLADSSWPSFHGGATASGYTTTVAQFGKVAWSVSGSGGYESTSVAVAKDGTIYHPTADGVRAVTPDGRVKWTFETGTCICTPAVGKDGTVYFVANGTGGPSCYAVNPDGTRKWSYQMAETTYDNCYHISPTIDSKGNVYMGASLSSGNVLISFDGATGQVRWQKNVGWLGGNALALGANDTIYMASKYLYAYDTAGNTLWSSYLGYVSSSSPVVGSDGSVYCGTLGQGYPNGLYAFNSNGSQKWYADMPGGMNGAPAVTPDGTSYCVTYGGTLWAHDAGGNLLWKYLPSVAAEGYFGSPIVDGTGTIFYTVRDSSYQGYLIAMNPNGTERGRISLPYNLVGAPAIGPNGEIYVGAGSYLTAIVPEPSSILALLTGLAGTAGIVIRRRK